MKYLEKNIFALIFLLLGQAAQAGGYEILELGDGKGNPGPIKLKVNYVNKKTHAENTLFLETLRQEDIPALKTIRTQKPVYERYGNHQQPSNEEVQRWLENKLLPRVGSQESVFPFVLKDSENVVKGLINVGYGYKKDHRMFGVFTSPGENVALVGGSESGYSEWGNARGTAAVHAAGDFMMLWHTDHPLKQEIPFGESTVKLWGNTFRSLSATADADNVPGRVILEKLGMEPMPMLSIRTLGYQKDIGNKVYYELSDYGRYDTFRGMR